MNVDPEDYKQLVGSWPVQKFPFRIQEWMKKKTILWKHKIPDDTKIAQISVSLVGLSRLGTVSRKFVYSARRYRGYTEFESIKIVDHVVRYGHYSPSTSVYEDRGFFYLAAGLSTEPAEWTWAGVVELLMI